MIISAHFYFKLNPRSDLKEVAQRIVELFNAGNVELRESSNYLSGEYYRAETKDLKLTIAYVDDADVGAYQYWLEVKPVSGDLIQKIRSRFLNKKNYK